MLKTLLYINEDLASSIALRFTDYLNKFVDLSLFVTHVEEPDKKEQVGTGWVRRTWEDGVASSGKRLIERMLRTENIDCPLAGRPKVFVGDRDKEIIYELRNGLYNLFIKDTWTQLILNCFTNLSARRCVRKPVALYWW